MPDGKNRVASKNRASGEIRRLGELTREMTRAQEGRERLESSYVWAKISCNFLSGAKACSGDKNSAHQEL